MELSLRITAQNLATAALSDARRLIDALSGEASDLAQTVAASNRDLSDFAGRMGQAGASANPLTHALRAEGLAFSDSAQEMRGMSEAAAQLSQKLSGPLAQGLREESRSLAEGAAQMEKKALAAGHLSNEVRGLTQAEQALLAQTGRRQEKDKKPPSTTTPLQSGILGGLAARVGLPTSLASAGGLMGLAGGVMGLAAAVGSIEAASQRLTGLQNALKAVSGSSSGAAQEMAFVRSEADRLGVGLESSGTAYMRLAAAAKNTSLGLQGAKDVFSAVAEAAVVLNLSSEETAGALRPLAQMLSTGTVQADELKNELGNFLPGALDLAARAMGKTTAEFVKDLEQGKVKAEEFLPRFARVVREEFGKGLPDALKGSRAELARFGNAWTELKGVIGKGIVSPIIATGAEAGTATLKGTTAAAKETISWLGKVRAHLEELGTVEISIPSLLGRPGIVPPKPSPIPTGGFHARPEAMGTFFTPPTALVMRGAERPGAFFDPTKKTFTPVTPVEQGAKQSQELIGPAIPEHITSSLERVGKLRIDLLRSQGQVIQAIEAEREAKVNAARSSNATAEEVQLINATAESAIRKERNQTAVEGLQNQAALARSRGESIRALELERDAEVMAARDRGATAQQMAGIIATAEEGIRQERAKTAEQAQQLRIELLKLQGKNIEALEEEQRLEMQRARRSASPEVIRALEARQAGEREKFFGELATEAGSIRQGAIDAFPAQYAQERELRRLLAERNRDEEALLDILNEKIDVAQRESQIAQQSSDPVARRIQLETGLNGLLRERDALLERMRARGETPGRPAAEQREVELNREDAFRRARIENTRFWVSQGRERNEALKALYEEDLKAAEERWLRDPTPENLSRLTAIQQEQSRTQVGIWEAAFNAINSGWNRIYYGAESTGDRLIGLFQDVSRTITRSLVEQTLQDAFDRIKQAAQGGPGPQARGEASPTATPAAAFQQIVRSDADASFLPALFSQLREAGSGVIALFRQLSASPIPRLFQAAADAASSLVRGLREMSTSSGGGKGGISSLAELFKGGLGKAWEWLKGKIFGPGMAEATGQAPGLGGVLSPNREAPNVPPPGTPGTGGIPGWAGPVALAGNIAGSMIGGQVGGTISGALSGAAAGAMIGSVVPVIGTAIGAIVGGLLGGAGGFFGSKGDKGKDPIRAQIKQWVEQEWRPAWRELEGMGFSRGIFEGVNSSEGIKGLGWGQGIPQAHLEQMKAAGEALKGAISTGLKEGFEAGSVEAGKRKFYESLREGIKDYVQQGLIEGVLKSAALTELLAPAVQFVATAVADASAFSTSKGKKGKPFDPEEFRSGFAAVWMPVQEVMPALDGIMGTILEAGRDLGEMITGKKQGTLWEMAAGSPGIADLLGSPSRMHTGGEVKKSGFIDMEAGEWVLPKEGSRAMVDSTVMSHFLAEEVLGRAQKLETGGRIVEEGLFHLHEGERVLNRQETASFSRLVEPTFKPPEVRFNPPHVDLPEAFLSRIDRLYERLEKPGAPPSRGLGGGAGKQITINAPISVEARIEDRYDVERLGTDVVWSLERELMRVEV